MTDRYENFPIGSRVRPTERARLEYRRQFEGHMAMIGTVIGYGEGVHVQWPEEFDGHERNRDESCPGHCWYCGPEQLEIVIEQQAAMTAMPVLTLPYNPAEFEEGFPPGTIVENVGGVALGITTRYLGGRGTLRGVVIAALRIEAPSPCIHVDFGTGFEGHQRHHSNSHSGHCLYFLARELRIISMPTTINNPTDLPAIPAAIPRLKVTITRNSEYYNQWQLRIENGPQVGKVEIMNYLDKTVIRRLGRPLWRQGLETIIHRAIDTYGVDPQVLIDAVSQAVLAKQAREATGTFSRAVYDSELQMAMGSQPAIIAIGDQLFTLQPKGVVKAGRAMAIIKERIVGKARENAAKVKLAAEKEARGIIVNAERQLADARATIERERRAASTILTIPEWAAGNYIKIRKWDSIEMIMAMGIEIGTKISSWQLVRSRPIIKTLGSGRTIVDGHKTETIRWTIIPELSRYHTVTIWVPFNPTTGAYSYKSSKIIDKGNGGEATYSLPHFSTERCCMELQGLPAAIKNIDDYKKLSAAMNRGNSEVNLMSLLTSFNSWHPDIQVQCPKGLKKIIDMGYHCAADRVTDESLFVDTEIIEVSEEAKQTFSVDSLRAARIARGEELPSIELPVEDGLAEMETEVYEEEDHG